MPSLVIEGLDELRAVAGREAASIDEDLGEAIDDALRVIAGRAERNAPKRSGRMAASVTPQRAGLVGDITVTARRVSASYPGGFPYPQRIERQQPFLRTAVQQEAQRVTDALEGVLDDIQRRWGGA
jgi:hypothetical protein